ncbi:sce7726 family protein [Flexivirga caeni]|uniref:sce7726 family protein n=1 Tax=Flexivirga caeni TaxID=2294115 RepID=UPI003CCC8CE8
MLGPWRKSLASPSRPCCEFCASAGSRSGRGECGIGERCRSDDHRMSMHRAECSPTSIILMIAVTEDEIRSVVHDTVACDDASRLVVDEFVIGERGRIDIAVIGDHLVGYELKSDRDTLTRLPRQMDVFGDVFDFCVLVVTTRHLSKARQILKRGWGLAVVDRTPDDGLSYQQVRQANQRRSVDTVALALLLWRDELLHALDALGQAGGYRGLTRNELAKHLADVTERDQLRSIVTTALTERQGWRVAKEPGEGDGTCPRAGVSSRFLARRFLSQRR